MSAAIAGMKGAFAQLSAGKAQVPQRIQLPITQHDGISLFMPAYLPATDALAVKIVSVFPRNLRQDLPVIYGVVVVLDSHTGMPLALLEGSTLTAIRTGAASGAATDLLARQNASTVAVIGSGVQARTQLEAVCTVRTVDEVRVYSPNKQHAQAFANEMAGFGPVPMNIKVAASADDAVPDADIVCTATSSSTPVFTGALLAPGSHVNAVGSFRTDMQEVDVETVRRALVVVDSREAAREEAGDLMIPIESGAIGFDHIHAELGEIVNGTRPGRTSAEQITYFKSVGVAVQDAVAASIALQQARQKGLGVEVKL
jgi:ornithine cyclodeaminase